ncbi:MAG: hypothetical protein IJB83_00920, partial [Bacilli bacterium]|nr:hypothetical protein [Bacilli bacterium]
VEAWYTENIEILGTSVTNLIVDEAFCNDTSVGTTSGNYIYYGAYTRLYTNKNPQYKCPNESDKYSVSKGNISKPVALLTADEVSYAGGIFGSSNVNLTYYLYSGEIYWLMSPYLWSGSRATAFRVNSKSASNNFDYVYNSAGLLPSISIKVNAVVRNEGTGEYNNPYIILTQ